MEQKEGAIMSAQSTYEEILTNAEQLALATLTQAGEPSVRIVNYCFDAKANTVYVCTNNAATKAAELAAHDTVAFTTTPLNGAAVRVTGAKATLTNDAKPTVLAAMDKKYASFAMFDAQARANMNCYALTYPEAEVFSRGTATVKF